MMKLYVNKILQVMPKDDNTAYNIIPYESEELVEFNIQYGKPQQLFDDQKFMVGFKSNHEPLFPEDRINPVKFDNLDEHSVIIFYPPKGKLLSKSLLVPDDVDSEVLYSKILDRPFYVFSSFQQPVFKLAPKLTDRNRKLITSLKNDPLNLETRAQIIDLMAVHKKRKNNLALPKIEIKEEALDYTINFMGSIYQIDKKNQKFRDILFFLSNQINTEDTKELKKLWDSQRAKPSKTTEKKVLETLRSYKNFFLRELRKMEEDDGINKVRRFSEFLEKNIIIKKFGVSFTIPPGHIIESCLTQHKS